MSRQTKTHFNKYCKNTQWHSTWASNYKKTPSTHASQVHLDSEIKKGTTFSFAIDFKLDQPMSLTKFHFKELHQFTDGKILLVDDNDVNILLAKRVMEKWGLSVDTAKDGGKAVDKVKSINYDMVLIDLHMPVMDGYEATKEIRKLGGIYEALPIIAFSASMYALVEKSLEDSGLSDFITKPFSPEQLHQKISKYLNAEHFSAR